MQEGEFKGEPQSVFDPLGLQNLEIGLQVPTSCNGYQWQVRKQLKRVALEGKVLLLPCRLQESLLSAVVVELNNYVSWQTLWRLGDLWIRSNSSFSRGISWASSWKKAVAVPCRSLIASGTPQRRSLSLQALFSASSSLSFIASSAADILSTYCSWPSSTVAAKSMRCSNWFVRWPITLRPFTRSEENLWEAMVISSRTTERNLASIVSFGNGLFKSVENWWKLSAGDAGSAAESCDESSDSGGLDTILLLPAAGEALGFWRLLWRCLDERYITAWSLRCSGATGGGWEAAKCRLRFARRGGLFQRRGASESSSHLPCSRFNVCLHWEIQNSSSVWPALDNFLKYAHWEIFFSFRLVTTQNFVFFSFSVPVTVVFRTNREGESPELGNRAIKKNKTHL